MLKMLFVFAHLDDEVFGPWGTIRKYSQMEGVDVTLAYVASGDEDIEETEKRLNAIEFIAKELDVDVRYGDGTNLKIDPIYARHFIDYCIDSVDPNVIYTHSINDIHHDHRTVAEAVAVCARPHATSTVQAIYAFESVPSSKYGNMIGKVFNPNHFEIVDLSEEEQVKYYGHYCEYKFNYPTYDGREFSALINSKFDHGARVGAKAAEAFEVVLTFG